MKKSIVSFEVYLNGRRLCRAGVGEHGVLHAILGWVKRNPARRPRGLPNRLRSREELTLEVGGIPDPGDTGSAECLRWVKRSVAVGDEVRILIKSGGKVDRARSRKRIPEGPRGVGKPPSR